jgi:hypothetical protein
MQFGTVCKVASNELQPLTHASHCLLALRTANVQWPSSRPLISSELHHEGFCTGCACMSFHASQTIALWAHVRLLSGGHDSYPCHALVGSYERLENEEAFPAQADEIVSTSFSEMCRRKHIPCVIIVADPRLLSLLSAVCDTSDASASSLIDQPMYTCRYTGTTSSSSSSSSLLCEF